MLTYNISLTLTPLFFYDAECFVYFGCVSFQKRLVKHLFGGIITNNVVSLVGTAVFVLVLTGSVDC